MASITMFSPSQPWVALGLFLKLFHYVLDAAFDTSLFPPNAEQIPEEYEPGSAERGKKK